MNYEKQIICSDLEGIWANSSSKGLQWRLPLISGLPLKLLHQRVLGFPFYRVPQNLTVLRQIYSVLIHTSLPPCWRMLRQFLRARLYKALQNRLFLQFSWLITSKSCQLHRSASISLVSSTSPALQIWSSVSPLTLDHVSANFSLPGKQIQLKPLFNTFLPWDRKLECSADFSEVQWLMSVMSHDSLALSLNLLLWFYNILCFSGFFCFDYWRSILAWPSIPIPTWPNGQHLAPWLPYRKLLITVSTWAAVQIVNPFGPTLSKKPGSATPSYPTRGHIGFWKKKFTRSAQILCLKVSFKYAK